LVKILAPKTLQKVKAIVAVVKSGGTACSTFQILGSDFQIGVQRFRFRSGRHSRLRKNFGKINGVPQEVKSIQVFL